MWPSKQPVFLVFVQILIASISLLLWLDVATTFSIPFYDMLRLQIVVVLSQKALTNSQHPKRRVLDKNSTLWTEKRNPQDTSMFGGFDKTEVGFKFFSVVGLRLFFKKPKKSFENTKTDWKASFYCWPIYFWEINFGKNVRNLVDTLTRKVFVNILLKFWWQIVSTNRQHIFNQNKASNFRNCWTWWKLSWNETGSRRLSSLNEN